MDKNELNINKIVGLIGVGLVLTLDFSTVVHCMDALPRIPPMTAPIVPPMTSTD